LSSSTPKRLAESFHFAKQIFSRSCTELRMPLLDGDKDAPAGPAQIGAPAQNMRFSANSPSKALKHDIAFGEVTLEGINAAAAAGVSQDVLKRARDMLAEQSDASGEGVDAVPR
jgi:hypothetical protein